ncbi:MAG TPA: formate dehydrogenase accessory protein FdhE [Vicinamibacterales bacterium]|nr:formate dehydrogenase accessory protein FdhE [Vicinamibacterales bacterium]
MDLLKRRRPEWSPWLAVVDEALRESLSSRWEAAVPGERGAEGPPAPLIAGTAVRLDGPLVQAFLDRLIEIASRQGTPKMTTLKPALRANVDLAVLFRASVCQDHARIDRLAAESGADAEAFQAVVALVPLPFLQACNRRLAAAIPTDWMEGYCPVCGSWPALAEMRGIERSRYLRCGRCGGEWHAHILHCAYCGTNNHDDLVTLVPEKAGSPGVVEACRQCRGYVKAFTRLQACPAATVIAEDLNSVGLDVAALEHGYARPAGAGRAFDIMVNASGAERRFFAWNA